MTSRQDRQPGKPRRWPVLWLTGASLVLISGVAAMMPDVTGLSALWKFDTAVILPGQALQFALPSLSLSQAEPRLGLTGGTIALQKPFRRALEDITSAVAAGTSRMLVSGVTLTLGGEASDSAAQPTLVAVADQNRDQLAAGALGAMVQALAGLSFDVLEVRNSSLQVVLSPAERLTLVGLDFELKPRRKSGFAAHGVFSLQGLRHTFDLTVTGLSEGKSVEAKSTTKPSVKLTVDGAVLTGALDGEVQTGPSWFVGTTSLRLPDAMAVLLSARKTGGGHVFNLTSSVEWSAQGLAFDKAALDLDGQEAKGALAISFSGRRPSLNGTLAIQTLDVARWLATKHEIKSASPVGARAPWSLAPWSLDWLVEQAMALPRTDAFDADLRVSANSVAIGGLSLSKSAATLTLRQGTLLADLASTEIGEAQGGGQLAIDLSGAHPRFVWHGRIDGLDTSKLALGDIAKGALSGPATLVTDLSATGTTGAEIVASLNGRVGLIMKEGGRMAIDLPALFRRPQTGEDRAWIGKQQGDTAFSELNAKLGIAGGLLTIHDAAIMSDYGALTILGTVDLGAGELDIQMRPKGLIPTSSTLAGRESKPDLFAGQGGRVSLEGSLAQPRMRRLGPATAGATAGSAN